MDPETVLNRDSEVVLDARKARLLDTAAPQRSEDRQRKVDFQVAYDDGDGFRDGLLMPIAYDDLYVLPTEKMTQGTLRCRHPLAQGRADAEPGRIRAAAVPRDLVSRAAR